ncbi:hypothetical protein ACOMHN_008021 [Nucella lapillus]
MAGRCHSGPVWGPVWGPMWGLWWGLFAALSLSWSGQAAEVSPFPKLLLITFDGFGWNFLHKLPRSELPGFQAFMEQGVHVRWVENVFPSETRPNHMSLVTGLYSESHGIVANRFYDHALGEVMPAAGDLQEGDSRWVDVGAEPIWVTNSQAGGGRRSGTVYWPCADARIKGRLPDEIRRGEWAVNETVFSAEDRVDLALGWLTSHASPPVNLAAVYTYDPDTTSHLHGPDSPQVLDAIRSRDAVVSHLLGRVKALGLEDDLNIILTADHGQLPLYPQATINMDLMLDPAWYTAFPNTSGAVINLWPKEGYHQQVVQALKGAHPNLHVATSNDSAELVRMHYAASSRIAPVVLYAEPGWIILTNHSWLHDWAATGLGGVKGGHGWDPQFSPHMWPLFLARGPAFRRGVEDATPFHLVDVYPLMCHVLGLTPAPNNGSLAHAAHILAARPPHGPNYTWLAIDLLVVIVGVVMVVIVGVVIVGVVIVGVVIVGVVMMVIVGVVMVVIVVIVGVVMVVIVGVVIVGVVIVGVVIVVMVVIVGVVMVVIVGVVMVVIVGVVIVVIVGVVMVVIVFQWRYGDSGGGDCDDSGDCGDCVSVAIGLLVAVVGVVVAVVAVKYVRHTKNVTASYRRTFSRAGATDDLASDGMVVISDEEL